MYVLHFAVGKSLPCPAKGGGKLLSSSALFLNLSNLCSNMFHTQEGGGGMLQVAPELVEVSFGVAYESINDGFWRGLAQPNSYNIPFDLLTTR